MWKKFFLYFFIFSLSGCNSTKIFYNFGDILISWQIDNYFDLTDEQEEWIEEKSISLLNWHRREELPLYKKFLIEIKEKVVDGLSMSEINYGFSTYETKRDRIFERVTPDIVLFLANLSNYQIDFLEKKMLEENNKIDQKMKNYEERKEQRKKYFFEQMENWFGELSKNQIKQLDELQNQWYKESSNFSDYRMEIRLKTQKQFLSLLRSSPDNKKIEKWLKEWTFGMVNDANYMRGKRVLRNKKRILEVDKILTSEQRLKAITELDYWIKIIDETIENS